MKKKIQLAKRIFAAIMAFALSSVLFATPVYAANDLINEPYEYPVMPGTSEWAEFQSFGEMIEACQIPDSKVQSMTTEALVQSILNHPLWGIYFSYEPNSVYDIYKGMINALAELESREDAATTLLTTYINESIVTANELTNTFDLVESKRPDYCEILLAQPVFYNNLTQAEFVLLENAITQKQVLRDTEEIYSETPIFYEILGVTRAEPPGLPDFSIDGTDYVIKTPKGSDIDVVTPFYEPEDSVLQEFIDIYEDYFPHANLIGTPTVMYNCHSFAFYSTNRYTNKYWMNDPRLYMTDGSYIDVYPSNGTIPAANLRVEFKPTDYYGTWHSVVIVGRYSGTITSGQNYNLTRCQSKWGAGGLYEHALNYHPWAEYDMYFYQRNF